MVVVNAGTTLEIKVFKHAKFCWCCLYNEFLLIYTLKFVETKKNVRILPIITTFEVTMKFNLHKKKS